METTSQFYVYVLFRPTGEPCYVGKGRRDRWSTHLRSSHNLHLAAIIQNAGGSLPRIKVREGIDEREAFETEIALIAAIGREAHGGPLVNRTDGGDGGTGYRWSEEQKARLGILRSDPVRRTKFSEAIHRYYADPKNRERQSAATKLAYEKDPTLRAKISAAMLLAQRKNPERAKAIVAASIKATQTPEYRAKKRAITNKNYNERPELRELVSKRFKELWANSEWREVATARSKERAKDPVWLKKMSDAKKGVPLSDAQKAANDARRGKKLPPFSDAHRAALSASGRGCLRSEAQKRAVSEGMRLRWLDPVYRARQLAARAK